MKIITEKLIQDLLAIEEAPCLSLYMPTNRHHPDNRQDPIRFKNLLKEMEQSLLQKYSSEETKTFLAPLEKLTEDDEIWNNSLDGLAVFSAPNLMKIVKLPISVEALAIVADSFHTKPLRKYLQSTDRYHLLAFYPVASPRLCHPFLLPILPYHPTSHPPWGYPCPFSGCCQ